MYHMGQLESRALKPNLSNPKLKTQIQNLKPVADAIKL